MHAKKLNRVLLIAALMLCGLLSHAGAEERNGFIRLFDGRSLQGWTLVGGVGPGYIARDGVLICPADGGGKLMTEKEYSDFIFRFQFKLDRAGNNGVGCQILDDSAPEYAHLLPGQYCGSIYKVLPAKRGALKPVGEWNAEEITAIGRRIKVVLNGKTIVDASLNDVHDPETLLEHPGMLRDQGHIGFLGHGPSEVQFRDVWIKDLSKPERDNTPPPGFAALFDGKDLKGWKGLVADPPTRAKMSTAELAAAQQKADREAFQHWKVEDGQIVYDGKNNNLCTAKDYGDFELLVDWKIPPGGDSGIYLRGSPQVQIWDPDNHPERNPQEHGEGSGGLYNNEKHSTHPLQRADKPIGAWNRFRILMVGDRVTVYLNNVLVVNAQTMENYWERDKPLYPTGQIELQHHGGPLWFKNIYIREIPRQ